VGKNQKEIAALLGVSPATISRELKRTKVKIDLMNVVYLKFSNFSGAQILGMLIFRKNISQL
jgi:IS30 family transposase